MNVAEAGGARSRSPLGRGSLASSATKSSLKYKEGLISQARKYEKQLSLETVLAAEASVGSDKMQATRILRAMEKQTRIETETTVFETHMNLVEKALLIDVDSIAKLQRDQREELLAAVCPKLKENPASQWCEALLSCVVRDKLQDGLTASKADDIAKAVVPTKDPPGR